MTPLLPRRPSTHELLTMGQAAERLGVTPNTVMSWLERGKLRSLTAYDVEQMRKRLHA